jgi:hypothetical protein
MTDVPFAAVTELGRCAQGVGQDRPQGESEAVRVAACQEILASGRAGIDPAGAGAPLRPTYEGGPTRSALER